MLKHISKHAGTSAATLAVAVVSVGCTAMGSDGPTKMSCAPGDPGTAHAAPSVLAQNGDAQKPTSVEERHFDIYRRYRALSAATEQMEVQVSGGVDGRGQGNAGMPAARGGSPKSCSIRDLKTSD